MADPVLSPRPALLDIDRSQPGAGVTICELRGLGLATMQTRKGQHTLLRDRVRQHFLLELPNGPAIARAGEIAFVGIGPHYWLAMGDGAGPLFAMSLKQIVASLASVSDQSGGYAIFRVGGPAIRDVLAKGFQVDLHPRTFEIGAAATTIVAHIGASIWRCEDKADGSACFEIALFRSLAKSFSGWFSSSAAEFGCEWQTRTVP
ncbi:heterotetrameric sarcosine oxidase gamma subunit [Bradyrhizobium sp. USDA 4524]|uniref:sarcosine oxidase subunit gamma n=1 Tax=unclassified Bradyrhizobium TaxID=2631580 RepID=UPI0020A12390|nr:MULTISPECIES: sarcosine oxidase subunit gamma family protein [unclassified Bradyrhizobium]MCP1845669.1 sarcosine oxidase subunit gamma [Bradyrhizobium sp. USDA 4538]MCP1907007.1 sarcosine oxidase subunit gamma [Bradyrhizobium sp. USDA 4537]MCP1985483.1 sarcosine oxidase subunit gamma [Bradyrhizobium sp. USDA 4539]